MPRAITGIIDCEHARAEDLVALTKDQIHDMSADMLRLLVYRAKIIVENVQAAGRMNAEIAEVKEQEATEARRAMEKAQKELETTKAYIGRWKRVQQMRLEDLTECWQCEMLYHTDEVKPTNLQSDIDSRWADKYPMVCHDCASTLSGLPYSEEGLNEDSDAST